MSQGDFYNLNDPGGFFYSNPESPKSKTPPQADYIGAAKEQGAQNIALARVNAAMNNPNISGPFGGQSVSFENGVPNIKRTLAPGLESAANSQMSQLAQNMSQPFNYSGATDLMDKTQASLLARLEPQFQRDEDAMRTRLANQGIGVGTEAYNNDIDAFSRAKNDARLQSVLQATQAAPQALQSEQMIRNQPLQNLMAMMGGQTQGGFNTSTAQPANYQQATKDAYQSAMDAFNYQNAQKQNQQGLMANAGMAALMFL